MPAQIRWPHPVVGDERQMPPTRFSTRLTGGDPDDEDVEAAEVAYVENILALFVALGAAERILKWHYRSRHDSLIALSNAEFYESRLCVLVSALRREAGRGVLFTPVPKGVYDSENTRTNVRGPAASGPTAILRVRHLLFR